MFQNPLLLFGLTAVSVPIIIHLLNRRKFQRVTWAAMRFLRLAVEKNQRRIEIEDIILLILRCALVAILALALARPEVRASFASILGSTKLTAVIVLDNSYSMSQSDGTQSSFQAAKAAAEQVIKTLPQGASVAVVLASDIARELIPEPTEDRDAVLDEIKNAPIFDRPTNLLDGIRSGVNILKDRRAMAKEVYVITDGQLSGWRQMDAIRNVLVDSRKSDIRSYLLFVGKGEERNLAVSAMHLASGLTPVNQPVRVDVTVKNFGASEARNVTVKAAIDNEAPTAEAVIGSIPAGQEGTISLRPTPKTEGYHTITARIDPDRLPADDARSVGLLAVKTIHILMIEGETATQPRDSELFYVRNALMPIRRSERDSYFIRPTVRAASDLSGIDLGEFDAVIAANVPDFSDALLGQLANFVKSGGGLMVFPGEKINRNFYNQQLYQKYGLLPAKLGDTRGDAKSEESYFRLSEKSHQHEIVSIWRDPAAGSLSTARFFKAYNLIVDDPAREKSADAAASGTARIVIPFADNKPAIVEHDYGQGRVILFASTADAEWNDLAPRGQFVPLMDLSLKYILARKNEHLTIKAGEEFAHTLPGRFAERDVRISRPTRTYADSQRDGGEESRRTEMEKGAPTVRFKQTDFAGAYEVKDAISEAPIVRFAVQSDAEESSPQTLGEAQYAKLAELASVIRANGSTTLDKTLQAERGGTRLWMALIWTALALAAVETLLAHRFSRSK